MRRLLLPLLLLFAPLASAQVELNVATYNLRLDTATDGRNTWSARRDAVRALVRYHGFDLWGTQEALANQLHDLEALDEYAHVGAGREDLVNTSSLAGDSVSVGDVVQGYFSYDTDTGLFGNFGAGPVYSASTAANALSALSASHNFALAAPTSQNAMLQVSNNLALLGGGDNLAIGSVSENDAAEQLLAVNFFDPSGLALSGDQIPGAIDASAYSQSSFSYLYIAKDSHTMLGANGALTSLVLISSVPEAQTYSMLLSGLGILAFLARRRRQYSH